MKKVPFYILFVCVCAAYGFAYTYVIDTFQTLPNLESDETMLITGQGGGGMLQLEGVSSVTIESTSTLNEGYGGVWQINLATNSSLYMTAGQIHMIDISNNATAELHGGLIQGIFNYQATEYWDKDNQVWVQTPHITLYYSGDLPTQQTINGLNHLVGTWSNGIDDFSIYLPDTGTGYDPYDNFEFILVPEPATLILLAAGGLLLKRKR